MTVQIRNPELIRLLAADFVTRRELVTTPGNRVTLTSTDLTVAGGGALTLSATGAYTLTVPETGTAVLLAATQTLTNKTLTTPTIGDFSNATHDHADAAGGGQLSLTTAVSGILPPANGGTGVNNDTRTLTINTNSGTLAFGAASKTLTINENLNLSGASGQTLTLTNSLTVQGGGNTVLSSSSNFTLTIPATGTAALLGTANVFTANQTFEKALPLVVYNNTDTALYSAFRFQESGTTVGSVQMIGSLFVTTARRNNMEFFNNTVGGGVSFHTQNLVAARMIILAGGNVGIGETSPAAQLQVEQTSATGAKPTLRLQQLDLSEEMIRFDTTVGAGNPVNTTALGTYYGRVRVWVEGVGERWLALYNA